jgi:hypothetical protein
MSLGLPSYRDDLKLALASMTAVFLFCLSAQAQVPGMPKPTLANAPYGKHPRQLLDFYQASSMSSAIPAPLV